MLQYGHCAYSAVLLFCNNWHGNICFIYTSVKELLQVSDIFLNTASFTNFFQLIG